MIDYFFQRKIHLMLMKILLIQLILCIDYKIDNFLNEYINSFSGLIFSDVINNNNRLN